MSGLAIRSVQLAEETTQAWKAADVSFIRRGTHVPRALSLGLDYEFILNLGKSEFRPDDHMHSFAPVRLWNKGQDILPLLYPGYTRALLDDLMPDRPHGFPVDVWVKAPGMKGKGKHLVQIDRRLVLPREWDWQRHVEGTEYRIISVGHRNVQAFVKTGNSVDRTYEWCGLGGTPARVKAVAKEAASRLSGFNVIGWDIVDTGREVLIFEGNSCPGVNVDTANRVVTEIRRQIEELI